MPIRINLLAEAQAAEDLRRRDPVKRSVWVAGALIVMVLFWISSLQVKIIADKSGLGAMETRMNSHTNEYYQVLNNKQKLKDTGEKLTALNRLAANRFLQATLLNAPMHATVEGIQIVKLRTENGFDFLPEIKEQKEGKKIIVPARAATAVERAKLVVDAKDTSAHPGDEQINKFKETLAETPYFKAEHISTNNIMLKNLSTPQSDGESGKTFVLFTLECSYPDKSR